LEVDYAQLCEVYLLPGEPYYEQFSQNARSLFSLDSVKKYQASILKVLFKAWFYKWATKKGAFAGGRQVFNSQQG
jgi:hypothetical protein